ncbi:MAG: hypothetical protein HYV02_02390 [Deltaproteobacteria bacterium]|nr:hypothetical protein [Deltaproteobacteria bacterium]
MVAAKSVRIDPNVIKVAAVASAPSLGKTKGSTFGDIMGISGAFAPLAGEAAYQFSGNTNAAAVLHSAFSAFPGAYAASHGGGGMAGSIFGSQPGMMGYAASGTLPDPYGYGTNDAIPGMDGTDQATLINTMNQNNLQLLELQAIMQNNMQQWTTKSNVLKSTHDAKMAMIQHFAIRG